MRGLTRCQKPFVRTRTRIKSKKGASRRQRCSNSTAQLRSRTMDRGVDSHSENGKRKRDGVVDEFESFPMDEETFDQALLAAAVMKENVPTENDPNVVAALNEEERIELLEKYFHKRVFVDKNWKLENSMPKKGGDKAYDARLKELGLATNRPKAARLWRKFKTKKGIQGPLKLSESPKSLMEEYELRMNLTIVSKAIECAVQWDFPFHMDDLELLGTLMGDERIELAAWYRVYELNTLLAKNFSAISETNLGKRIDTFEKGVDSTTQEFIDGLEDAFAEYKSEAKERYFLPTVFARFHECLRQSWKAAMHDGAYAGVSLIGNVTNAGDIVGGSKGTVYNIAGWMLNMLNKAAIKDKTGVRERFVTLNKVTANEARDNTRLITFVVDDRDYQAGALLRPGVKFFEFAMNVEAIYIANYTGDLASRYRGDLSREIDLVVQRSSSLKALFTSCFPQDFTQSDKETIWKAYDLMLQKYGKMRARDLVKSMKAASRPNASEDGSFSTRQAVKVAHMVAMEQAKPKLKTTNR